MRRVFCIVLLILILLSTSVSFASTDGGTKGSVPGSSSTGTGGGSSGGELSFGPNRGNSFGLKWQYWDSSIPGENDRLHLKSSFTNGANQTITFEVDEEAVMAAYVMKNVNKYDWRFYSWAVWYENIYKYPGDWRPGGSNGFYRYGIWNDPNTKDGEFEYSADPNVKYWQINRPLLVEIIEKDGWICDNHEEWYKKGTNKLNVVWVTQSEIEEIINEPPEVETETIQTLYRIYDSNGDIYKEKRGLREIFENPVTTYNYDVSTKLNEHVHNNKIKAIVENVTREAEYKYVIRDGKGEWEIEDWKYTRTPHSVIDRNFQYISIRPSIPPSITFIPLNLNRNGHAKKEDYESSFGKLTTNKKLKVSIDNMQNISDNSHIKMLDTNDKVKFKVSINNEQLGIPKESEGGWKLYASRPSYSTAMSAGKSNQNTGRLTTGSYTKNVTGNVSNNFRWNGRITGSISGGQQLSINEGKGEIIAKDFSLNKNAGWKGNTFEIKNVKTGLYGLSGSKKDWWDIKYQEGMYWSYGARYRGQITIDSVKSPTSVTPLSYQDVYTKNVTQPFLRGTFESKTVGGNLR